MSALCAVDWLGISCRVNWYGVEDFPKPRVPAGFVFAEQGGTPVWEKRAFVLDEAGDKLGTILWLPHKPLDGDRVLIEVANKWLYSERMGEVLDILFGVFPCASTGLSRFDICVDWEVDKRDYNIIQGLANGRYYVANKRKGSLFWMIDKERGQRVAHSISFGSKTSSIKWKIYWKWHELHEGGGCSKPYIEDAWVELGMCPKNVWRIECSIQDGNRFSWGNDCIKLSALIENYKTMICSLIENKFVIRRDEGHKDRRNDTRVRLIESIKTDKIVKYNRPIAENVRDGNISTIRALWKLLQQQSVLMNDTLVNELVVTLVNIIEAYHLGNYFLMMADEDVYCFIERCKDFAKVK